MIRSRLFDDDDDDEEDDDEEDDDEEDEDEEDDDDEDDDEEEDDEEDEDEIGLTVTNGEPCQFAKNRDSAQTNGVAGTRYTGGPGGYPTPRRSPLECTGPTYQPGRHFMTCRSRIAISNAVLLVAACRGAMAQDNSDFFERRVRPILVANCVPCHGDKKQESDLRLDSRDAALKGGSEGPAVLPGQPDSSLLVQAIRWDGARKMPPEKKLSPKEIEILSAWVAQGAPWPVATGNEASQLSWRTHWAFQPVRPNALPGVRDPAWARTAIDDWVLFELDRAGITPAPEADRRTLIRRATFDLLGLPPTPEQIAEFLADPSDDAWERLLARLLASPAYGERWGRHWLDVARYADTKGYVFFEEKKYPWAYTYRDYVIRALNADLAYDRFVTEQLAADRLDLGADQRPLTALGFLTVGAHFMNNTHDIVDDRIDVVSRGLLGLTVTCARCHDHKFDPISMADYYSLYGVFRSCYEPTVLPTFEPLPDNEATRKFTDEMHSREKKLVDFVTQKHSALVLESRQRAGEYLLAAYHLREQPPTDDFMLLVDKGDLNPTMILRWQVYLAEQVRRSDPVWALWHACVAIPENAFAERLSSVLDPLLADGAAQSINRLVAGSFRQSRPTSMPDVAQRYGELLKEVEQRWQAMLQRATEAGQPQPTQFDDPDEEALRQVLYGDSAPPQVPLAMDWGFLSLFPDRPTQGEYEKLLKEVEQWMMTGEGAPPRAMVLLDASSLYDPRIMLRGNPHRRGDPVPRRFLSALDPEERPFQSGSGRREMAEKIVDPDNPLTARVFVNRVWVHHFGEGLVRTPSDFGLRSDPPSHPELLDWLAAEFIRHDWSLKWLHREIMRSAVYRQSSAGADSVRAEAIDVDNRLLWHAPRRRLDFESQRDAMLAVADSLDARIGGPPVDLLGDNLVPRRTIYGNIDRMDVPPVLTTFDFPDPLTTSPQRIDTTVAPQALHTMNSPFVAGIAQRIASRISEPMRRDPGPAISWLYVTCVGRNPTDEEFQAARQFLESQPEEHRWTRLCHAMLLTNEFFFVD